MEKIQSAIAKARAERGVASALWFGKGQASAVR